MPREHDDSPQRPKRRRIAYACDLCRAKKNRCDGERPSCGACKERQQDCVYPPQKSRNPFITEEYIEHLKSRNRFLEDQLRAKEQHSSESINDSNYANVELSEEGDWSTPMGVDASLSKQSVVSTQPFKEPLPISASMDNHRARRLPSRSSQDSPFVPSLQTVQPVSTPSTDGDGSSARAYFGESSTFNFMEKVMSPGMDRNDSTGADDQATIASLAASKSSTNPMDRLLGADTEDPLGLPHRSMADWLVDSYFRYRHPLHPYLHESTFRQRYGRIWTGQVMEGEEPTGNSLDWLGLVNMIFAFGHDYESLGRASTRYGRVLYFRRAQTLVFSALLQGATIELVQALLLMGLYYHNGLELDNCWTVVGLAIRMAQGLGLHLSTESTARDVIDQEVRKRTWWGCFVLERILSAKVGRHPSIDESHTSVELPIAVDDVYLLPGSDSTESTQPAGVASYVDLFRHTIAQARLLGRVVESLYGGSQSRSNGATVKSRDSLSASELLAKSIQLDGDLATWKSGLPAHLQFDSTAEGWIFERQRSVLQMRYLGCRQLIHRQALLVAISTHVEDPFQSELISLCVRRCVSTACETIFEMLLLEERALLRTGWHNSHYIFTALCILVAFQTLNPEAKYAAHLPDSIEVPKVISQGVSFLKRAGELHALASRYVEFVHRLQLKLEKFSARRQTQPISRSDESRALPGDLYDPQNPDVAQGMANVGNSDLDLTQLLMDFGTDFFDIEHLFDSSWFDMPYNLSDSQNPNTKPG